MLVVIDRKKSCGGGGQIARLRVEARSPPRGRNPTLVVPRIPQPRTSDVFEEQPIRPPRRLPTDEIELRSSQVQSRKDSSMHAQFLIARTQNGPTTRLAGVLS